jgi:hypothetical protein
MSRETFSHRRWASSRGYRVTWSEMPAFPASVLDFLALDEFLDYMDGWYDGYAAWERRVEEARVAS